MDIKYNKHKQELRDDPIMDFLLNAKIYLKNNTKALSTILIVAVIVVAALVSYNMINKANANKVETAFGNAMISYDQQKMDQAAENFKIIAQKYARTPQGIQSAYLVGGILYDKGNYDEALKYFEIASKEKKEFIGAQALEGLAACYEGKGDISSALKYLDKALNDNRIEYRHGAIQWKMALLLKSSDTAKVKQICKDIIADTSAQEYHQPAENLLTVIDMPR